MNILPAPHAIQRHQGGLAGPVHFCPAIKRRSKPVQWYTLSPLFIIHNINSYLPRPRWPNRACRFILFGVASASELTWVEADDRWYKCQYPSAKAMPARTSRMASLTSLIARSRWPPLFGAARSNDSIAARKARRAASMFGCSRAATPETNSIEPRAATAAPTDTWATDLRENVFIPSPLVF